jgi:hypothetical protein
MIDLENCLEKVRFWITPKTHLFANHSPSVNHSNHSSDNIRGELFPKITLTLSALENNWVFADDRATSDRDTLTILNF